MCPTLGACCPLHGQSENKASGIVKKEEVPYLEGEVRYTGFHTSDVCTNIEMGAVSSIIKGMATFRENIIDP